MKINKTTQDFISSSYEGDGKYYTTCQGSKSYCNTIFENFANRNGQYIKVKAYGNDAPRGGQTGNFVIVEFTEDFKKLANELLTKKEEAQKAIDKAKKDRNDLIVSFASKIAKIEGESRLETQFRMSNAIGQKIDASIFNKAVSMVRR